MKNRSLTRRKFAASAAAGTVGAMIAGPVSATMNDRFSSPARLALNGGDPVRTEGWTRWPIWDPDTGEPMLEVLQRGKWWMRVMR